MLTTQQLERAHARAQRISLELTPEQNVDRKRAYMRAWVAANPDKIKVYAEKNRSVKSVQTKESAQRYRDAHRGQINERQRARRRALTCPLPFGSLAHLGGYQSGQSDENGV